MKENTKKRKKSIAGIKEVYGKEEMVNQMYRILVTGKQGFDTMMKELGRMVVEAIMYIEREEIAGPDYQPTNPGIYKWASQPGSVYIGEEKIKVNRPRLRSKEEEIPLKSYQELKNPEQFSEELWTKILNGISCQKYQETVIDAAKAFGVSPSSVSRHIIEVTAKQLKEFKERNLEDFKPFALFLDTIHRGGEAFIIALGIDLSGRRMALGFWQGATENHEIGEELLGDLERRGLKLSKNIIWVTDGGKGIIKALKDRFGKKLIHQRCTIHKDRNIQKHLAKKYRKEANLRFSTALEQNSYEDARQMLLEMEKWLRDISAYFGHIRTPIPVTSGQCFGIIRTAFRSIRTPCLVIKITGTL
jgi:transposase-like protein